MHNPDTPPRFLLKMDWVFDQLSRLCFLLAGTALVVMTAIFAWLVFGRYVLNDTPTWVEQVSLLLVMVIAFLGAAAGVKEHTHLSVVVFRNIVPTRVRTVFVFVSDSLMTVFGGMMFWYGIELICGALLFLFSLGHLIKLCLGQDKRQDNIDQG